MDAGQVKKYRFWVNEALAASSFAGRVLAIDVAPAGETVSVRVRVDSFAEDTDTATEVARVAAASIGTGSITVLSKDGEVLVQLGQIVTP